MTGVLVTGASGFVGSQLLRRLVLDGFECSVVVRTPLAGIPMSVRATQVESLSVTADLQRALSGVQVVIHCAGRAHIVNDTSPEPLVEFRKVNVDSTLNLALQAAAQGVRRFIFLSSAKVNGEVSPIGLPFSADDAPAPLDPYGLSKWEAEQGLLAIARKTGMEVVIIRPVLVYGPGVKANFLSMMNWLAKGVPLPLGAINNQRSLVALDNLVDLVATCIHHPGAANQIFMASDGQDVSTSELLTRLGHALGTPARLLPVPVGLLQLAATLLGKRTTAQRLCGSLQVDITKTKTLLNWTPPVSLDEALQRTADDFLEHRSK